MVIAAGLPSGAFSYFELLVLTMPEVLVAVTALFVLFADLVIMRDEPLRSRRLICGAIACFGCVAAIGWILAIEPRGQMPGGILVVDPLARIVKAAILGLSILTALVSIQSEFTRHVGEYFALILLATIGMMLMVSTEELLMLFIALELASLSLYVLAGFDKGSIRSSEAALKYFLFGSTAAAFTLFGLSLVFGLAGTTHFRQIASQLAAQPPSPLLVLAMLMVIAGLGFKVAAVPFQLWAPDAYQGAPTPSAALIASGSKVASFFVLAKLMMLGFGPFVGNRAWHGFVSGWGPILAALAALSMILGNLAALSQSDIKRLLAYSAVAHAGYALLGAVAGSRPGMSSLIYYVVTYAVAVLGAFGVVAVVESNVGNSRLTDLAGLARRAPGLSFCMLIFVLSLAGIPPFAGFFGKFHLFTAALSSASGNLPLLWLIILAIGLSAVSLYYYLQVLKQIYVVDSPTIQSRIHVEPTSALAIMLAAVLVLVLGCAPDLLLQPIVAAIAESGF